MRTPESVAEAMAAWGTLLEEHDGPVDALQHGLDFPVANILGAMDDLSDREWLRFLDGIGIGLLMGRRGD